jgi:hypothetical protein
VQLVTREPKAKMASRRICDAVKDNPSIIENHSSFQGLALVLCSAQGKHF